MTRHDDEPPYIPSPLGRLLVGFVTFPRTGWLIIGIALVYLLGKGRWWP